MTLYYCPECKEGLMKESKDIPGLFYCECGMTFRTRNTDIHSVYKGDDKRKEIKKVIESTLQVFYTKNEETNRFREREKELAVKWLTDEIMKGALPGGTVADSSGFCSRFGSDVWNALQKAILIRDPVCAICGKAPSKEVHHIRPRHLKGKDHPRNLIGLCLDCHDEVHRKIDQGIQDVLEASLDVKNTREKKTTLDKWGDEE